MILRHLLKRNEQDAAAKVPVAMMFVTIGLMLIVVGVAWPGASSPAAHTGPLSHDFLRGFLIGIAIVLEIVGVGIAASAARVTRKS
jgi:hypothetical protein